ADRLLPVKSQGFSNRLVGKYHRFLLIRPCELIAILRSFYNSRRNFLTQNVRINCTDNLTVLIYRFSHGVREHRGKFSEILLCQIGCMHLKILHVSNPPVPVYSHEGAYKVQIVSSAVAPSKRQPQSLLSASPISVSAPVERGAHPLKGKTIFQPAHHKAQSAPQKPPISHRGRSPEVSGLFLKRPSTVSDRVYHQKGQADGYPRTSAEKPACEHSALQSPLSLCHRTPASLKTSTAIVFPLSPNPCSGSDSLL